MDLGKFRKHSDTVTEWSKEKHAQFIFTKDYKLIKLKLLKVLPDLNYYELVHFMFC